MKFVHGHWLFMALRLSYCSPNASALCICLCVYLDKLLFAPSSPEQTNPVILFIKQTLFQISLQQNEDEAVAEEEDMGHVDIGALSIPMWIDSGWQWNSFSEPVCVRWSCCNELWQRPALVLKTDTHFCMSSPPSAWEMSMASRGFFWSQACRLHLPPSPYTIYWNTNRF